jgi:molybdopterin synthase sulfur carrier subunit
MPVKPPESKFGFYHILPESLLSHYPITLLQLFPTFLPFYYFSYKSPTMPTVKFTYALKRFFPSLADLDKEAEDLPALINAVDNDFPGLKKYVLDEQGALRKHVNIFIDGELIKDRQQLSDSFHQDSEVFIMQALSGG